MATSVTFLGVFWLLSSVTGQNNNRFETIFTLSLSNFPLENIEFDPWSNNDCFVSGKNVLYKFNTQDGNIEKSPVRSKLTGPDYKCLEKDQQEDYCGDDYNSVLVITPDSVITCSTLYGGRCVRRDKTFLNNTLVGSTSIKLVSRANASAVGIYLNVSLNGNASKHVLLFAKEYTPLQLALVKLDRAAIFSISQNLSGKTFTSGLSEVDIFDIFLTSDLKKNSVRMDYRVVLENEDFVFLLVNQISQAKLVKICKTINAKDPKKVYEDIPLTCSDKDGTHFPRVVHGTFVYVSGKRYLVALFTNSTVSSAVCVYEENEIYKAFLESRKNRYGCPKNDLREDDKVFDLESNKYTVCINVTGEEILEGTFYALTKEKFCNNISHAAPQFGIIVGLLALNRTAVYTSTDVFTVVGSTVVNDLVTLYIGTEDSCIVKVFLDPSMALAIELEKMKVPQDESEIKAVRNVQGNLYLMSQNKIVKVLRKNCEDFSGNCHACMKAKDAHCGWCITNERCVEKSECDSKMNHWLPSVRNQCLQLKLKEKSHGVNLDNVNQLIIYKNVYFEPQQEDSEGRTCKLNDKNLPSNDSSDHVQCTIDITPSRSSKSYTIGNQTLSIWLNNRQLASTELVFYRCSVIDRCGECVEGSIKQCYWCVDEGKCKYSRDCSVMNKSVGPDEAEKCPQVLSAEVRIPNGQNRTVTFTGKNLETTFGYQCIVNEVPYHGVLNGNSISCDVKVSYEENEAHSDPKPVTFKYSLNSSPDPSYNLDAFNGNPNLLAYKCEHLSSNKRDCSTCYYQNSTGYECSHCGDDRGCINKLSCSVPAPCKTPEITVFTPTDGAVGGGTEISITGINLGLTVSDINNVTVAGVMCSDVTLNNRTIKCITGASSVKSGPVVVIVGSKKSADSAQHFEYKDPVLRHVSPNQSIQSGGRRIHIVGENLTIGNLKYEVNLIPVSTTNGEKSKKCILPTAERDRITCKPNGSTKKGDHKVEVIFDGNTTRTLDNIFFSYLDDPTVTTTEPSDLKAIKSGGTKFVVKGTGFVDVLENLYVKLSKYSNSSAPCLRKSNTKIECEFPRVPASSTRHRRRKRQVSNTATYARYAVDIHLDGFHQTLPTRTLYVSDPFLVGNQTISFDPDEQQDIILTGANLAIVTKKEDYFIVVGTGECAITRLNDTELVCQPPSRETAPRAQEDKLYIRVRVGNLKQTVGVLEYTNLLPVMYIVIGVLGFLLIVIIIAAVLIHRKMRTRNQKKIVEIMTEMQDIEQNTIRMNQEEFAEMQLNITDIKRDLVSTGIPYHPYQNYVQYILFPKEVEAGTLNSLTHHSGFSSKNVEKAMDQFDKLMTNKYFVKSLIGTLEKQRKITLIDKAQFSANFSVVMVGKMRNFFEIVNCLLSTLVDSANKKAHKTLFNRFESITLRLLSHWLSVSLYPHLKEGGGSFLFMLYKSTQAVIEKRPVDEVTGQAKNTLSEDSFLREKIDYQALKLKIDLNGNGNLYTCEVLDCDTINQVKSKCLYQIYKNKPASEMPSTDEVDLEWMAGKSGRLPLSNIDQTSERKENTVRRNTLQHYNVLDGSRMALMYKFSPDDEHTVEDEDPYVNQQSPSDIEISVPPDVHPIQSVSSTGSLDHLRQWHLVKSLDEEESHEKTAKLKDIVKTSHITNLMHTKLVLQDNIKEVFDSVLNHDTVPLVVHYLFGVLENLANKNGVEPDTLLCWKSESYAMRVWATLLVRPENLFDVQKAKHVEPCLNVIKQVFIDCFHSTKISKDSSLQKLLFAQEVPHYQKKTEQFFKALANKTAVTDADFWSEMSRLNSLQQKYLKFSKPAALQKLYKFVQQYVEEIIEDLDAGDETSGLQFGSKLDDIVRLMETDT
ncbi:plexin-A4-like isoform X2 [Ostrea edulis]|uniref:plexin-A4-like isoform X2 n=1 Tax=Ostrea edulis TaxID=37623 RepID=UPI0024AEBE50|nr:plexin-A4-like isoform X2 [Ostrea edulis]